MIGRFAAFTMLFRVLGLLVLTAGAAAAQDAAKLPPFKATDYPLEVRKSLSYGVVECKRQGGGKVTFAPDTVRKVDLNGDGRDDYVVNFEDTECPGYVAAFCGTGGCMMDFLLTLPDGKIRSVFSDRIRGYEILPGEAPRTIRFQLHGSYCGGHGNPSCFKEQRITDKPFVFREPKE
jgi:hypothetical protein